MYGFYSIAGGREAFLALLQGQGSVSDYEVMLKNRDGSQVPSSISAKIQFDANSTPLKIVGSMRDITERKRAEKNYVKLVTILKICLVLRMHLLWFGIIPLGSRGSIWHLNG